MNGYLYFPNNFKNINFTVKSRGFQRKHELIATTFILLQFFVCNRSSIRFRINYRVQVWSLVRYK